MSAGVNVRLLSDKDPLGQVCTSTCTTKFVYTLKRRTQPYLAAALCFFLGCSFMCFVLFGCSLSALGCLAAALVLWVVLLQTYVLWVVWLQPYVLWVVWLQPYVLWVVWLQPCVLWVVWLQPCTLAMFIWPCSVVLLAAGLYFVFILCIPWQEIGFSVPRLHLCP
jgi:hypothetical protein